MPVDQQVKTLAQILDEDKGFIASRRLLMTLSVLLLVSVFGGVSIKEANTFIFKIEFLNPKALNVLLAVSVFACSVRYYSFSHKYHFLIKRIWHEKLLNDSKAFYIKRFPDGEGEVGGLLGGRFQVLLSEYPGLEHPEYKSSFFLKRSVVYDGYGQDEEYGNYSYRQEDSLNAFSKDWKLKHFLALLRLEFKHRLSTLFQNREYLDVLLPYFVAVIAMASYIASTFYEVELVSIL